MSYTSKKKLKALLTLFILFLSLSYTTEYTYADSSTREASFLDVEVNESVTTTRFLSHWTYSAEPPYTVCFWDQNNKYTIASYSIKNNLVNIYRYSEDLRTLETKFSFKNPLKSFGDIIMDRSGNYYVVWGQDDTNKKNIVVTSLCKYDYSGNLVGRCDIKGYDSNPYIAWNQQGSSWGTMEPFHAGNCTLAISGDILTCNYARQMYSGHQSNFIFYVQITSMKRLYSNQNTPYCSHSFDQDVIATADGSFLFANHGDASIRGFDVSKVTNSGILLGEKNLFHFREGSNRSYGYNETYAQLGGLAETNNAYILCASSEKTLSLEPAPTNEEYCGHSEARNLFVQIMKKNYYSLSNSTMFLAPGVTRVPTGTKPTNALTPLKLTGNEVDYGVIWLTDLDSNHYVCNPKVLNIDGSRFVVLWEELPYTSTNGHSYYQVLDEYGNTVIEKTKIPNTYLMGNTDLTYHDGSVYWTSSNGKTAVTHMLDISEHNYVKTVIKEATSTTNGSYQFVCKDCGQIWTKAGIRTIPAGSDTENYLKNDLHDPALANVDSTAAISSSGNSFIVYESEETISDKKNTSNSTDKEDTSDSKTTSEAKSNEVSAVNSKLPKSIINNVKATKTSFKIKVKKAKKIKGYQIQYSTNKNFKKAKSKKSTKTTIKIKKLKRNRTYYIRVRTYKKEGKKTIYSKWSKTKKKKTKA